MVWSQSQNGKRNIVLVIGGSLGWPLLAGMVAWVGFYALIHRGWITNELLVRYCASHPVEYVEVAMFFVGLAALVIKAAGVARQYARIGSVKLPPAPPTGQAVEDCSGLLQHLSELPASVQGSYLVGRLRDALQHVRRKGSADGLDEELKYLADLDSARQYDGFALVRLVIWAIPILGFLGTVIGITLALGNLSPTGWEESMGRLTSAMSVAFDTTAVALALSMVLMFAQFLTDRLETELLAVVDARVLSEMTGRFQQAGTGTDPQLGAIRRMAETVVRATEDLVRRQAEIWQTTVEASQQRWGRLVDTAGARVEQSLRGALHESIREHAAKLAEAEKSVARHAARDIEQLAAVLGQNAERMQSQQDALLRQGEVLLKAVEATGRITTLQQSLNENLQALAGAKNFEETVMSLSAAIHLLNNRLGQLPAHAPKVELGPPHSPNPQDRAA